MKETREDAGSISGKHRHSLSSPKLLINKSYRTLAQSIKRRHWNHRQTNFPRFRLSGNAQSLFCRRGAVLRETPPTPSEKPVLPWDGPTAKKNRGVSPRRGLTDTRPDYFAAAAAFSDSLGITSLLTRSERSL